MSSEKAKQRKKDTRSQSLSVDFGMKDVPIRHRGMKVVQNKIRKRAYSASNFISGAPPNEILTDERGVVLQVTPNFLQFTGYAESEMVGRKCNFLQGEQTDPQDVLELRDAMQHRSRTSVVILNYCKNGRPFWNVLTIVPEFAPGEGPGKLARYHGEVIGIPIPPNMQGRPRLCLDDALALLSVYSSVPRGPPQLLDKVADYEDAVEEDEGEDDEDLASQKRESSADEGEDTDSGPAIVVNSAAASRLPTSQIPVYMHQNYAGRFTPPGTPTGNSGSKDGRGSRASHASSSACADDVNAESRYYFVAETCLPTAGGRFRVRAYRNPRTGAEPLAIIYGNVEQQREDVVVRVHDQCLTSEIFGSLKCDCKQQLDFALSFIQGRPGVATAHPPATATDASAAPPAPAPSEGGMVLYLPQEGRGIGLANKIAAYAMQESGFDTVDANRELGLPDDAREYDAVRDILEDLGVRSVRLLTNNPRKIECLRVLGITVSERLECVVVPNSGYSMHYVHAKAQRMGHMIDVGSLSSSFARQQEEVKKEARQRQQQEQRRLQREDIARRLQELKQQQEELERLEKELGE